MHHKLEAGESELDALNMVLRDLRTISFRSKVETLTPADFDTMMQRSRRRLLAMRDARMSAELAEEVVELTDAGGAVAMALQVGRTAGMEQLLQHHPELMTGRQLAELPEGVNRARTYGGDGRPTLVSLDGGRS